MPWAEPYEKPIRFVSARAALEHYFTAKEAQGPKCVLPGADQIRGNVDPTAAAERVGVVGECLDASFSEEERVLLELETRCRLLPLARNDHAKDPDAPPPDPERDGYTRCELMERKVGGRWYARKYKTTCAAALDKLTIALVERGLMDPPSWWAEHLAKKEAEQHAG